MTKLFLKNKPLLVLAPMAGITDSAFRLLCRRHGADLVYSEMVSADGLVYGKKSWELVKFDNQERPIVIQLFGKRPENFARSAEAIVKKLKPEAIDINMGCPAKKVIRSGHGASLIKDQELACEIVRQVKAAVGKKCLVSVKTRLGWRDRNDILTFAPKLEKAGMDFICLHGRTFEQGFSGLVDYEMIKAVKTKIRVPLIANGAIKTPADAAKVLKLTKADGLAIGMATWGRPWIFQEIKDYLANGKVEDLTWAKKKKIIVEHAKLAERIKGKYGIIELRKHLCWYVRGFPGAASWRQKLVRVETVTDVSRALKEIKE